MRGGLLLVLLVGLVGATVHEATNVQTFSRGFGQDHLLPEAKFAHIQHAFDDIRQVLVSQQKDSAASFLEVDSKTAKDESFLQTETTEENWPTTMQKVDNTNPAPVTNPYSIQSAIDSEHPCGKCTPGSTNCQPCTNEILMSAGPLHFHVVRDLHTRNLIRSVKYGTSAIPPWDKSYPVKRRPDEVHHHRVAFPGEMFTTRPIVLVTIMPVCDGDSKCDDGWTDVFAVSLSHVSTNEFAVNIVRLDSLPNNTWGQQIHLAWVAFEPNDARAKKNDLETGKKDAHVTLHMGPGT